MYQRIAGNLVLVDLLSLMRPSQATVFLLLLLKRSLKPNHHVFPILGAGQRAWEWPSLKSNPSLHCRGRRPWNACWKAFSIYHGVKIIDKWASMGPGRIWGRNHADWFLAFTYLLDMIKYFLVQNRALCRKTNIYASLREHSHSFSTTHQQGFVECWLNDDKF